MLGITLSYILGLKLGLPVLKKYGPKIRIKEHHIEKHIFYLKNMGHFFNDWLFYTGVRHLTAYFAGVSNLTLWRFCLYAYGGALIWISVLLGLAGS